MLNANKGIILLSMIFLQIISINSMSVSSEENYRLFCKDKNTTAIIAYLQLGYLPDSCEGVAMLFKYISDSKNMECVELIEQNKALYSAWISWFNEKRSTKPSKHENKLKRNLRKLQDARKTKEF